MDYNGLRAVRIYDNGYIHGLLVKEGRKFDYILTLRRPIRLSKVTKGQWKVAIFSIPDFLERLKTRLKEAKFPPSRLVKDTIETYS